MIMHEEHLFEMVNEAVEFAKAELESEQELRPFAMILFEDGNVESLKADLSAHEEQYEMLISKLKQKVADDPKITALAIIARVTIPAHFKPPVSDGIRVHLEERDKSDNKVGARFLYVPYQLYRNAGSDDVMMQLHNPIPIAFPAEIFTK